MAELTPSPERSQLRRSTARAPWSQAGRHVPGKEPGGATEGYPVAPCRSQASASHRRLTKAARHRLPPVYRDNAALLCGHGGERIRARSALLVRRRQRLRDPLRRGDVLQQLSCRERGGDLAVYLPIGEREGAARAGGR